jgi:hypothetical protein
MSRTAVYVHRYPAGNSLFTSPDWWAYCPRCSRVVSKYNFTAAEAEADLSQHLTTEHAIERPRQEAGK